MAIGSADNTYTLRYYITAPDGSKISYYAGVRFGPWKSFFNSTIVVNSQFLFCLLYWFTFQWYLDPSGGPNDGCSILSQSVNGTVVLFAYTDGDSCSDTYRCNQASYAGARGCLLYNVGPTLGIVSFLSIYLSNNSFLKGSYFIPTGSISLEDGQRIISTVTVNPSAIYTFTNLFALSSVVSEFIK